MKVLLFILAITLSGCIYTISNETKLLARGVSLYAAEQDEIVSALAAGESIDTEKLGKNASALKSSAKALSQILGAPK